VIAAVSLAVLVRSAAARHLTRDAPFWALADQCLVSGANFATNVLLARSLGLAAYGTFVSLYALTLYAWSWQLALLMMPAMSIGPQMPADDSRARYLKSANALQLVFATLAGLVATVIGMVGAAYGWIDYRTLGAWICATVAYLLQDGLRRYYFVSQHSRSAFTNDLLSYGGQLTLLVVLAVTGQLTIANAFLAIATASAAALATAACSERLLQVEHAWDTYRDSWRMGRDLWVSLQLQWANNNGLLLLGAWLIGPQVAGAVRAVQTLVGPLNVVLQAMDNVVPVRAAGRHKADPIAGLSVYLGGIARSGGVLLVAGSVVIAIFGASAIRFVYGVEFAHSLSGLLPWALTYVCLGFFLRLTGYRYRTVGDTRNVVNITVAASVTSFVIMLLLIRPLQQLAIVVAMVAGQCVALICAYVWSRTSRLPSARVVAEGSAAR
jgi:O-antigen/teichoic acid export membrane protein